MSVDVSTLSNCLLYADLSTRSVARKGFPGTVLDPEYDSISDLPKSLMPWSDCSMTGRGCSGEKKHPMIGIVVETPRLRLLRMFQWLDICPLRMETIEMVYNICGSSAREVAAN